MKGEDRPLTKNGDFTTLRRRYLKEEEAEGRRRYRKKKMRKVKMRRTKTREKKIQRKEYEGSRKGRI